MLPYSLEQYYQEVGRCGRDGSKSIATLFVEKDDEKKLWKRLIENVPSKESIQKTYKYLCHFFNIAFGETPQFLLEFNLNQFCKRYQLSPKNTYAVIKLLERGQVLNHTQYDTPKTTLRLEPNPKRETVMVEYLLRNVGGITAQMQSVVLARVANKCGISVEECINELNILEKNGGVEIKQLHVDSAIQFLTPREDKHTLLPILQHLDAFKKEKKRLADSVWDYCTTSSCYRQKLLYYFGEVRTKRCDSCSNCNQESTQMKEIILELKKQLSSREMVSLSQLVLDTSYSSAQLIKALDAMVNEEIIEQTNINSYRLL